MLLRIDVWPVTKSLEETGGVRCSVSEWLANSGRGGRHACGFCKLEFCRHEVSNTCCVLVTSAVSGTRLKYRERLAGTLDKTKYYIALYV